MLEYEKFLSANDGLMAAATSGERIALPTCAVDAAPLHEAEINRKVRFKHEVDNTLISFADLSIIYLHSKLENLSQEKEQ